MARITVEDCIDKFPSRFELVLVASNRARKLHSGENPTVEKDNDKNTVIALREIADETLSVDELKNNLIEEYQTATFSEDEDLLESLETNSDNSDITETSIENENVLEVIENTEENIQENVNTEESHNDEDSSSEQDLDINNSENKDNYSDNNLQEKDT